MALSALEKIKLQRQYKDKRGAVDGAKPLDKIKLLREVKEIMAQLKGTTATTDSLDLASRFYTAMQTLKYFIGQSQLSAISSAAKGEEKQFFMEKMVALAERIKAMPQSYDTDGQGANAKVFLHYFRGASDWYITEKDKGSADDENPGEQLQAFGYAILNGDKEMAEMGYISIAELIKSGVELDLYYTQQTIGEIKGPRAVKPNPDNFGAPTVADVGKALEDRGWRNNDDGGWFLNDKNTPDSSRNGYYMMTGTDTSGGNTGWVLVDVWDKNAFVPLGGSFSLTGNTVDDIVNGIETMIAEHEFSAKTGNKKLADLVAGSYNDLEPMAFLGVLKDIIDETGDVEPIKAPTIAYISKNKEKITAVYENAINEVVSRTWGHY